VLRGAVLGAQQLPGADDVRVRAAHRQGGTDGERGQRGESGEDERVDRAVAGRAAEGGRGGEGWGGGEVVVIHSGARLLREDSIGCSF
jgi:hypothetical protein